MQSPTSPLRLTFLALASTTVSGHIQPNSRVSEHTQPNSPVSGHVQLYSPAPYNASNNPHRKTAPDNTLGIPFDLSDSPEAYLYPCRGYLRLFGTEQGAPTATWAAGSDQSWSLQGEGNTTDGSCYIVFVNEDETGSQDNSDVSDLLVMEPAVGGYQGNCTAPHPGTDSYTQEFNFTVPKNLPLGVTTFAWIWDNGEDEFNVNCAAVNITAPNTGGGSNPSGPQPYETSSYAYPLASTTTRNYLNQTSTTFITLPKTSTIVTTTTFTPSLESAMPTGRGSTTSPAFSVEWTTVTVTQQAGSTGSMYSSSSMSSSSTIDMDGTSTPQTASIGPGATPMFPTTPPAGSATTSSQTQPFGDGDSTPSPWSSATTETPNAFTPQAESMGSGSSSSSSSTSSTTQTMSLFTPQAESMGPAVSILLPPTQTQSFSNQSSTGTSSTSSTTTELSITTTPQIESTGTASSVTSSSAPPTTQTTSPFVPQAESIAPGSSLPLPLPPTTTQTTTTVTPMPTNSSITGDSSLTTSASPAFTDTTVSIEDTTTVFSISTTTTTQVINSSPADSISTTITGLSGISSLLYSAAPSPSSFPLSSSAVYTSPASSSSSGGTTTVKSTTTITPGASGLPDSIGASTSPPWISYLSLTPSISYHSAPVFSASQIISSLPVSSSGVYSTSLQGVTYTSTTTTVWRTVTDYAAPSSAPALNSSATSSSLPFPSMGADRTTNTSHFWTANHCSCACPAGETDIAHCNCFCPLPNGLQNKMNTTATFKFEKAAVEAKGSDGGAARPDDLNAPYHRLDRLRR